MIKELLYDEQYTIAGAKKKLAGEIRGPNREGGQLAPPKTPGRSLQPPPSLAARFAQPASPAPAPTAAPTGDERPALRHIAKQLQEILDLLDEGDAANVPNKGRRK